MMEMVLAAGVKVILHAMVVRVKKEGNTVRTPTLIFRMGGVDYEKARRFRPQFPQFVKEATVNGDLDLKREDLLVFQGTPARGRCLSIARVFMMWMGPIPSTLPGLRLRLEGNQPSKTRNHYLHTI